MEPAKTQSLCLRSFIVPPKVRAPEESMFASERLWDMAYLSIEDMDCLPTVEKVQQSQKRYPNDRGAYIDQHEG